MNLNIDSRGFALTDGIRAAIETNMAGLEEIVPRILGCHISLNVPHKHRHKGMKYSIRIDIILPGKEIIVRRDLAEDLYAALHDACDVAKEQALTYAQRRRREVKFHKLRKPHYPTTSLPEEYDSIAN